MADNAIAVNGGSPVTFATDDIGSGVQAARYKIMLGADGVDDGNISSTNPLPVSDAKLTSDTPSSVSSSATTVTLIAANANRLSLTIFNNSTAILYVAFGATATQAGAKAAIGAGGFYEMPSPIYTGVVSGIWASANGNASIYEGV